MLNQKPIRTGDSGGEVIWEDITRCPRASSAGVASVLAPSLQFFWSTLEAQEGARLTHSTHRFWTTLTLEMCWSVQHRDGRCRQQVGRILKEQPEFTSASVGVMRLNIDMYVYITYI